jgi:hypothetical protein
MFDSLELVPPGVAQLDRWQPGALGCKPRPKAPLHRPEKYTLMNYFAAFLY